MKRVVVMAAALALMAACTPVRMAGNAAVGTAQLGLGVVDMAL
ncbi:hypothetical protein [Limimaricola hongkongensis]|uniref:Lipoprotein n=1 Tax=Limimaricola hongkongensis DSM 17492 TaxID=1122180 RepID=A0A017HBH8_9RHOB|nr:hypothetical protein [Limimaricola hongkongensis]EYD71862.1 hypothetical protein Lokhon_01933 [Limimaricola hongkongensis DSM 17492]